MIPTLLLIGGCSVGLPFQEAVWEQPPTLLSCDPLIDIPALEQAVSWFTELSPEYQVIEIRAGEPTECSEPFGQITFKVGALPFGYGGTTYVDDREPGIGLAQTCTTLVRPNRDDLPHRCTAQIVVEQSHTNNENLLAHELGHAFGWSHSQNMPSQLMDPFWQGQEMDGLNIYTGPPLNTP